jgi:D-alanyl-D-alanine carboxypeptidase
VRRGLLLTALLAGLVGLAGCGSGDSTTSATTAAAPAADTTTVAADDARGQQVLDAVRATQAQFGPRAIVYGVWAAGKPLAVGAMGTALPGVPATPAQHIRVGNTAEWFMTTLLLRMVDQGKIALSDPIAKWYPHLPDADKVTVRMLATSTSGYNDYVTTPAFVKAYAANPFAHWTPDQLVAIAMTKPPLFAPGTSWAFSDTNFTLLGQILQRAGGRPLDTLYRENLFAPLHMTETQANPNALVPAPAIHGYTTERGPFEDATNWSPSWVPGVANVTSTVGDLGRWTSAYGSVLSAGARRLQTAPDLVGTAGMTRHGYYGFGTTVSNGWIANNPQLMGYSGIVARMPSRRLSVVVFTTLGERTNPAAAVATAVFLRLAKALTPQNPPTLSVYPRGK